MPTYSVTTNQHQYLVVDDLTTRFGVLMIGRVVGTGLLTNLSIEASLVPSSLALSINQFDDGSFAIIGHPQRLFPLIATQPTTIELKISADTYQDKSIQFTLPASTTFPVDLGEISIIHRPIRLQGIATKKVEIGRAHV